MKINTTNPDQATLRDEIAMRAMAALIQNDPMYVNAYEVSRVAYELADIMLEARKA